MPGRRWVTLGATLLVAAGVTGCQRSLFAQQTARTQFETYDRMRQRDVDPVQPDVFGNPQPNLRARLSRR
ncbi:MAG: hypothetical protein GY715_05130 [Planctomycetes bacterium]|nr:hypothetical protein [Planctomycetota bacterium]